MIGGDDLEVELRLELGRAVEAESAWQAEHRPAPVRCQTCGHLTDSGDHRYLCRGGV